MPSEEQMLADFHRLLDCWVNLSHQAAYDQRTDTGEVWELMEPMLDKYRPGHSDPTKAEFQ